MSGVRPITHYRDELRACSEAARDFQPNIVLIELGQNLDPVRVLVDEIAASSPASSIVGLVSADRVSSAGSESTLMIQALRVGVEDFIRRPVSSRDLEQILSRRMTPKRIDSANLGRVISFISNKGGVGKSTTAVNTAVELARRFPQRVLLVDGSLQMGVCATQLNLQPKATIVDAWQQRERLDGRLLRELATPHASGLHLLAAPASVMESSEIDDAIVSRVLLLARRSYDFIIVDTFPLFDRINMAILDLSDMAYIVAENVVPTLQIVRGFFELLSDVEFPVSRQRIVLNRFTKSGSSPGRGEVEQYLGRPIDHLIPFDKKVIQAANTGTPFVLSANRFSKSKRAIRDLVDDIANAPIQGRGTALPVTFTDAQSNLDHSARSGALEHRQSQTDRVNVAVDGAKQ